MNLIAYLIYLIVTYTITVHVGRTFYRNGRLYILDMLKHDEALTDQVNKVLLTGYYLLNIGFATIKLAGWKTIETLPQLIEVLSHMIGQIVILIAILHYLNMTVILLWDKIKTILTVKKTEL